MRYGRKYVTKAKQERRERKRAQQPSLRKAEEPKVDWDTLRPLIYAKTNGHCYLCGVWMPESEMTTDHAVIQRMGAKKDNSPDNLMPCCRNCNSHKGSRRLIAGECLKCGQNYIVKGLCCLRCRRITLGISERGYEREVQA